jgi:hypothetical protein
MRKSLMILIVFVSFASCKSAKVSSKSINDLSGRAIVKKNKDASMDQLVIKASLFIKYRGKEDLPNINASLRMVKDSIIWLSFSKLGFPIAKLKVTPKEVMFYEKIGKTYFEGDFELISGWLGTDFDFLKVQNLFLGEALLNLADQKYQVNIVENNYELRPKEKNDIFDILYWIDPYNFKIMKEEVRHAEKNQKLTILYKDFDKINESLFPKGFLITASGDLQTTIIDVSYKNVQFNAPLKFPFKIPSGYRNIEFK